MEEAGTDHPFLHHAWIRTWWECFGAGKRLVIALVKAGDNEEIAIAPLMLDTVRICGVRFRRLGFPCNVHTPRFDFIVGRRHDEAYEAIWKWILEQEDNWDVLELRHLPFRSPTLEHIPRLASRDGFLVGVWRSDAPPPYLPLSGSWEAYLKGLSRNHRRALRKTQRRLSSLGPAEIQVVTSPEQDHSLQTGLELESAGWKGKTRTAIQCQEDVRRFYCLLAQRAAQQGWLRLHFLTVAGRRIAFDYSLEYKNKIFALKLGWDPSYAYVSPYRLLCGMVLRRAFERGLREYDFLGPPYPWKLKWSKLTRPHYWLYVFPTSSKGRAVHFVKFRLLPQLQKQKLYAALRQAYVRLRNEHVVH